MVYRFCFNCIKYSVMFQKLFIKCYKFIHLIVENKN